MLAWGVRACAVVVAAVLEGLSCIASKFNYRAAMQWDLKVSKSKYN